jgi:iron(III) transport system substrate-binding protein
VLAASVGVVGTLAGCNSDGEGSTPDESTDGGGNTGGGGAATPEDPFALESFRGSGPMVEQRSEVGGPRIEDLPPLSGELSIYLGGGEGGLYRDLLDRFSQLYDDFSPTVRTAPSAQLANTVIEETNAGSSKADVFWAVDAGALGAVANAGGLTTLPDNVLGPVPDAFHPNDQWVGVAGRARSVPYNTDELAASDVPNKVREFPDTIGANMGWAPTYGAFQSFVTAMRLLRGDQATRTWLENMQSAGVTEFPDEFLVSNAVADGEITAGFANHYYALRVQAARPDAPIALAFTEGDAGGLVNVAGAGVVKGTQRTQLAHRFIRHLLTAEAQEFFATRTFAYPMVEGVPPVGNLPPVEELSPPDIDLAKLSNIEPTLGLMREAGVLA